MILPPDRWFRHRPYMAGVNPALLAHLAGGASAQPGHGGPAASTAADAPKPEAVVLHDAANELLDSVKAAMAQAEDLQSRAEMADEIDPGAEKAIGQAAKLLGQVADLLAQAEEPLGDARKELEEKMGGAGDDDSDNQSS